jgi:hypothetical protein
MVTIQFPLIKNFWSKGLRFGVWGSGEVFAWKKQFGIVVYGAFGIFLWPQVGLREFSAVTVD